MMAELLLKSMWKLQNKNLCEIWMNIGYVKYNGNGSF